MELSWTPKLLPPVDPTRSVDNRWLGRQLQDEEEQRQDATKTLKRAWRSGRQGCCGWRAGQSGVAASGLSGVLQLAKSDQDAITGTQPDIKKGAGWFGDGIEI